MNARFQGDFPIGGGEMGKLIRAFDWSRTELGPIEGWGPALRTSTNIVLQSPLALVMLWGPSGIMIYNDAYSEFAGQRHPQLLGSKVLEGWAEVADFNAKVLEVGLAGGTLSFKDQELTLYRNNVAEQVWMDLNYGPVLGEDNKPEGVLAIVVETTARVKAERALAEQQAVIEEANKRLSAESSFLRDLFEQAPSFMAMMSGPDHVFTLANAAYRGLVGDRGELVGKSVREAIPETDSQGFLGLLDSVYRSGQPFVGRGITAHLQRQRGAEMETRILDLIYQPVRSSSGEIAGIFAEGHDVTERATAEAQVKASEERLRALINATSDAVYRMSPDWREMRQLDGRGFLADADGPSIAWMEEYLFAEDEPLVQAAIAEAVRDKKPFQLEHRIRRQDGSQGWTFSRAVPLLNGTGEIVEWFGAASDVTARNKAEEHLRLVINELNHRVKNTLAMMQAIAAQTFPRSEHLAGAHANFSARIKALATASDLLTGERWVGASLRDATEKVLQPHHTDAPKRRIVRGPEVRLTAKSAISLSMALHELATNATKYGAWSGADGTVTIEWNVVRTGKGERLAFEWREEGGPPVVQPVRKGFGSRLLERGLAAELSGDTRLEFRPEGVVFRIDAPLDPYAGEDR
ncbi:PAS domain-containing protein [Bradyrhizobium sp. Arg816]|uniref:sensor histidine kinase n=1 Tax=Bradyrhizobium sp. Arg816 TaxID=2998491 RepID=UPI00249E4A2C|nr:PAS domain-containing protein [Bradyrhizobium sp. Arg816]MDI3560621.1 PAS domain-containing protein [Bradyrhizobium sp. Arg816]